MKKLKINTAAFILDIIGASFYLIALIIAFTALNYIHLIDYINIVTLIIWSFSLGASIVSIIALIYTRKHNMRIVGTVAGLLGHSLYFLFGIYPAPFCIALCILGAIITFRDNHYSNTAPIKKAVREDIIDIEIAEEVIDDSKEDEILEDK